MESISEALRGWNPPAKLRGGEDKVERLLADPLIVKFRQKHPEIGDEALMLHLNRLYQYVNEFRSCSQCPGLEACPNDFQGHYTMLSVHHIGDHHHIYDHKVSCKKFLSKQTENTIKGRIRSFYVDEKALQEAQSFRDIVQMDPERAIAVREIMSYIDVTQEKGLQTNGLYLAGDLGTGKTFLMCYMLFELAKAGLSGVIVYMPDFVEDLKAMMSESSKLKETIEIMKETDLLVFDDIGAETMNPWLRDHVMGSILNYRMNRKPTFYTSNYDLEMLERHFSFTNKDGEEEYKGKRIMDRIRPFVTPIIVAGSNKRGGQGM